MRKIYIFICLMIVFRSYGQLQEIAFGERDPGYNFQYAFTDDQYLLFQFDELLHHDGKSLKTISLFYEDPVHLKRMLNPMYEELFPPRERDEYLQIDMRYAQISYRKGEEVTLISTSDAFSLISWQLEEGKAAYDYLSTSALSGPARIAYFDGSEVYVVEDSAVGRSLYLNNGVLTWARVNGEVCYRLPNGEKTCVKGAEGKHTSNVKYENGMMAWSQYDVPGGDSEIYL